MLPWRGVSGFFEVPTSPAQRVAFARPASSAGRGSSRPVDKQRYRACHRPVHDAGHHGWWGGPTDRVIDGVEQTAFSPANRKPRTARAFSSGWASGCTGQSGAISGQVCGPAVLLRSAPALGFAHLVNLAVDPKEREPVNYPHLHTWTMAHFGRMLQEFEASVKREPLIPAVHPLTMYRNSLLCASMWIGTRCSALGRGGQSRASGPSPTSRLRGCTFPRTRWMAW